ncbi:MAG TPA: SDR family oxidoreductase [Polyangiaceae bacterium]|jgi:citronellol/citronellal dehydrogenase|nr:SDR family oxidoreductase [Polyangiaceae bacterium]
MPSVFRPGLFAGHVAIVTGGGSGIGLAIARTLCELGAAVAIAGRSADKLEAARAGLASRGWTVHAATCDIRDVDQVAKLVAGVRAALGEITVLVNNAGGQFPSPAEMISPKGWDAVIRNNLNGTFYMTREVAAASMIPGRRGRIVNITANVARGFPGMVHTGAARAGVENMTKTLAVEWAPYGIGVNSVAPGVIRSSGTERYPEALVELSRQKTPMKRLGTPEEVAELCAYLASEAASFVTGETWYIDGGAHLWGDTWILPDREAPPLPDAVAKLADP